MKLEDIKENVLYEDNFNFRLPIVIRFVKRIALEGRSDVMRFVLVSDHPAVSGNVLDYSTCDVRNLIPAEIKS